MNEQGSAASSAAAATEAFGPWNPGIASQVPQAVRAQCTLFRPENASVDLATADELRDLTGLPLPELALLRPDRLALHELLVRVTADFSVPDGQKIEDLGINFRRIVRELLASEIEPRAEAIAATYDASRKGVADIVARELAALFGDASPTQATAAKSSKPRFLDRWLPGRKATAAPAAPAPAVDDESAQHRMIAQWNARALGSGDVRERAACAALAKVVSALAVRHGVVWGSREIVATLAVNIACNDVGSSEIGRLIQPWLVQAAADRPYRLLPRQERPVVMNTKGPSASGKSTLRPLQKRLAGDIGVDWSDFALISPDIWRKQLIEYAALGAAYKYGGALSADEVAIIDQKLDRYMAGKSELGDMSHLLIDRFRFDSFAPQSDEAGSNLLTRFGHTVYLFFMITPPASLVERAWARGLEVGRYKPVDDTLAHSIEAYAGMPELFFTWVSRPDKRVHFEFLDNSVPQGGRPRTVAFGWNDEINVLDVKCLLDVERYRRVDVGATTPQELFRDSSLLEPGINAAFLRACVERFAAVNFADQATGRVYLRLERGVPAWADREALARAIEDDDTQAGLAAVAPAALRDNVAAMDTPCHLEPGAGDGRVHTLGDWGASRP